MLKYLPYFCFGLWLGANQQALKSTENIRPTFLFASTRETSSSQRMASRSGRMASSMDDRSNSPKLLWPIAWSALILLILEIGLELRAYFPGYPNDAELVNAWNNAHHYGALWRDDGEDLALQLNVIVEGGVTEANIKANYRWWLRVMQSIDEFLVE